jgi:hypothetical protein
MNPHQSCQRMTALTREATAVPDTPHVDGIDRGGPALRLLPLRDACSLVDPGGHVVFQESGRDGRRRCLEFARRHGVLFLLA